MKNSKEKYGVEAIVIYEDSIVLGMQKKYRWVDIGKNKKGIVLKTIGGQIKESETEKMALIRELREEIYFSKNNKDIKFNFIKPENTYLINGSKNEVVKASNERVAIVRAKLQEMNIFIKKNQKKLEGHFYIIKIEGIGKIKPKDLPALLVIPIEKFLKINFLTKINYQEIKNFLVEKEKISEKDVFSIMLPEFFKKIIKKIYETGIFNGASLQSDKKR